MSDNDIRYFLRKMPYTVRVGNIPGGMSEFITIQTAINYCVTQTPTAANRWTVLVWPGTYVGNIAMAQYVDVVGMDKEGVIIDAEAITGVTMADDSRISNLTINPLATGVASAYGIEIGDADGCVIEDINIFLNRTGSAEAVGIIEDTGAAVASIHIRNVHITTDLVTNTNTHGISIRQANKTVYVEESYIQGSDYGLALIATSTVYSFGNYYQATSATSRALYLNDAGALVYLSHDELLGINVAAGTVRGIPEVFIPAPNPSGYIGTHPAEQLTDGIDVLSRLEVLVPDTFHQLHQAQILVVPLGTGNMRRAVATNWGEVCSEVYNLANDAIAADQIAVTINEIECIDINDALTGITARDLVGVEFTREASNALDTIGANCWLLGLRLRYV